MRQVELYHNPEGQVYCLLDGPDEDAIRKHHAALGVDCGVVSSTEWTASPKGAVQPGLNAARRVSQHSRAGPSATRLPVLRRCQVGDRGVPGVVVSLGGVWAGVPWGAVEIAGQLAGIGVQGRE